MTENAGMIDAFDRNQKVKYYKGRRQEMKWQSLKDEKTR